MANTIKLGNGNWATKEGSLLAYNDENNNFKPLPFTTTRASSATVVNKQGLIETVGSGIPRIDFSDDANGALLLEPSATNLVLTSDSGNYGNPPASETLTISPDGTNNAVIPTVGIVANRYQQDITGGTFATNTLLTYSWYRKRISTPVQTTYVGDLSIQGLINLTIFESTTQIQSNINEYDRFQVVVQVTDGSLSSTFRAYFGAIVGVGNSSIAYFGHQLEENSYATSYIKTVGTAQTRVADTATGSGNSTVINSSEGTVYLEVSALSNSGTNRQISISNGSTSQRVYFGFRVTNNEILFSSNDSGFVITSISDATNYNKIAFKYKENDFSLFVNGVKVGADLVGVVPSGLDRLNFDDGDGGANFYGKTKSLQVYTTALSDAELTTLTTI